MEDDRLATYCRRIGPGDEVHFTRERPATTDNPSKWFAGGHNYSFPSGEAAWSASLVTPFVMEYAGDHPSAYGLLLLPLYVGVGRVKAQAHWQTDVLAGWAVGGSRDGSHTAGKHRSSFKCFRTV